MAISLIVFASLVTLIIYLQLGWLLSNYWDEDREWRADEVMRGAVAFFWPFGALVIYGIVPFGRLFAWMIAAPKRHLDERREQKEEREREERFRRREAEAKAAATPAPEAPVAEIAKINAELLSIDTRRAELLARKAKLDQRPDAARA